ncbi:MAG TPA: cytochrome c oxidase accessory protein CcoG [Prolixibacteraceae bacterium]|nr:cytochrome c oxidase accessory protein CcoG [Prolixibacteraceae bacterium]
MTNQKEYSFRDRPINIDEEGHSKWVYAKKPSGKWHTRRMFVAYLLLAFFVTAPFIKINGYPLILLDIPDRKFIIFGAIFWAQDTFILALLMLSFVLFIIVFTVTFGRIWCGWACPQTLFLEMVFRKIEFLVEGDYQARRKLDQSPWTTRKIFKKSLKHGLFLLVAFLMTNVFLMWFIGYERLFAIISDPVGKHLTEFLVMMAVSLFFYWMYSYFREQLCTMVCPYGRMQGVLLDRRSMVVSYDYKRGEPRGPRATGDCIDCRLCLAVCPTAIDIRNGTQLECINCTACIDECDRVMGKTGKPAGLIRYVSAEGIEKGHTSMWNWRNRAYSVVLILLFSFFLYTLLTRPEAETTILRTPGLLYQENEDGTLSNLYNIKIVNKTHEVMDLQLRLISPEGGEIRMAGNKISVADQGMYESSFVLLLPRNQVTGTKNSIRFAIYHGEKLIETTESTFVGPEK